MKFDELLAKSKEIEAAQKIQSLVEQIQWQKNNLATELQKTEVKELFNELSDEVRTEARQRLQAVCDSVSVPIDSVLPAKRIKEITK